MSTENVNKQQIKMQGKGFTLGLCSNAIRLLSEVRTGNDRVLKYNIEYLTTKAKFDIFFAMQHRERNIVSMKSRI